MSYRSELIQVAAVAVAAVEDLDNDGATTEGTDDVLELVREERLRQNEKWGDQHHDYMKWFTILGEEVGEVARAILEKDIGETPSNS